MEKQEKIKGIVMGVVKHSDTHSVVTLYTPSHGRLPVLARTGGTSAGARALRARMQPLMQIEAAVSIKSGREVQRLGKSALLYITPSLIADPYKHIISAFIADFLNRLLRDNTPDHALWEYLSGALRAFDGMDSGIANFHVALAATLTYFVGIAPDVATYQTGDIFDMRAGTYIGHDPHHNDILRGDEAKVPLWLSRLNIVNCKALRLSGEERSAILDGLLRYYAIHFPGIDRLRSATILRSLFR